MVTSVLRYCAVLLALAGIVPSRGQVPAGAVVRLNQPYESKKSQLLASESARKGALLSSYRSALAALLRDGGKFQPWENAIQAEMQAAIGPELAPAAAGLPAAVTSDLRRKLEAAWKGIEAETEQRLLDGYAEHMGLLVNAEAICIEAKDLVGHAVAQAAQKELIKSKRPRKSPNIVAQKNSALVIQDFSTEPDGPLPVFSRDKDRWRASSGKDAASRESDEFVVTTSGGNSFMHIISEGRSPRFPPSCSIDLSSALLPSPVGFKKFRFGCRFRVEDGGVRGTSLGINVENLGISPRTPPTSNWCSHKVDISSSPRNKWIETRSDWMEVRNDPQHPVTLMLSLTGRMESARNGITVTAGGNGRIHVDDVFIEFTDHAHFTSP